MTTVELDIACEDSRAPSREDFDRWISAAAATTDRPALVHVRVVGSEESATLNARYRNRTGPTNVLSFPVGEPVEEGRILLGDLVLCEPVIRREASEQGVPEWDHWAHISIHGTLHLMGYDHIQEREAEVMENRERELLAGFGIADPYADERASGVAG